MNPLNPLILDTYIPIDRKKLDISEDIVEDAGIDTVKNKDTYISTTQNKHTINNLYMHKEDNM